MINSPGFYIARTKLITSVDPETQRWIRNASDEKAAAEGMRFSEKKGQFVVDWIQKYCTLYEGSKAGEKMDVDDWQYEFFMQMFGWQRFDDEVGEWIRRFTKASVWIPKKNGKSPTLAAVGLYMLIGDGEQGQKCYSVARDGKQAMISHNHAIQMVLSSPTLDAECKVNNTTGEIRHLPSKSRYIVVSGDNSLSTEGYNGSLFVDETHVVDDELIKRLKRAGISRKEPVHIEMSTSGDNSDGYGYAQYQTGKKVQSGEEENRLNFLFMEYGVDQNTPVEFFYDKAKIASIAKKVNPTLGRIIRHNEFMQDWSDSQGSEKEIREFAMYRCNLWLSSNVTWIPLSDWQKCGEVYTLEDLIDMQVPAVGGLDLSKTQDMTALTLAFAVPDDIRGLLPYMWTWAWLPEHTANRLKGKKDFATFRPNLTLIKGGAIDYHIIAQKLEWIKERIDLRGIAIDPWNSDIIRGILMNDYGWGEDEIVAVRQTIPYMGPPTKEFERMVLRQDLRYCAKNRLLDWQIGHCYTHSDRQGNIMVQKPEPNDYRKVDCIVSEILAIAKLNNDPTLACNYTDSLILYRPPQKPEPKYR